MACLLLTDAGMVFLSLVVAWVLSGWLKALISFSKKVHGNFFVEFFRSGGMPSQHSALVVSVATAILVVNGFSILFVLAFTLAVIVMYDASHVRLSGGQQAELLKELAKKAKVKTDLKIVKGHTIQEVLVGAAVGIVSVGIVFLLV